MPKITTNMLTLAINNNDYNKIEHLLSQNPDFVVDHKVLDKALEKRFPKCFDLIIERLNFEDHDVQYLYFTAMNIYMKAKNEENKYFIDKLLDKKLDIVYYDFIKYLIKYDINKSNQFVENIVNQNDNTKIITLLVELLDNECFMYFVDIFNNKLSLEEQRDFIINNFYNNHYSSEYSNAYDYFLNNPDFDYNKLMRYKFGLSLDNHLINSVIKYGIKCSHTIINYFLNNPVDFKETYESNIIEILCFSFIKYNITDTVLLFKKNIIKSPLIINCPKINLLKRVIFNIYHDRKRQIEKSLNVILFCYILHKMGFNFDIYNDLSPNDITRPIQYYGYRQHLKDVVIDIVRFGKYIGQDIPDHLRDSIYKLCENSQQLNNPVTEKEINEMIKKVK